MVDVAELAYNAYKRTAFEWFPEDANPEAWPEWSNLPRETRFLWEAAAVAVLEGGLDD